MSIFGLVFVEIVTAAILSTNGGVLVISNHTNIGLENMKLKKFYYLTIKYDRVNNLIKYYLYTKNI